MRTRMLMAAMLALSAALAGERPASGASAYTLGPGDKVHVHVFDNPDLTHDLTIPPTGYFEFPFIGKVEANGKTITDLEQDIARRLAAGYLINPQVRVTITEYQSKKVHVMGAAKRPGTLLLKSDMTLLELITEVEGPTEAASGQINIMQARKDDAGKVVYDMKSVNYRSLMAGDVESNLPVQGNDYVIFESKLDSKENINITGAVRKPGIHPLSKNMTLLEAIVAAEGITQDAGDRINIIRSRGKTAHAADKSNPANGTPDVSFELSRVMTGEIDFKPANGDTIVVPRNQELDYRFFVLGEVKDPKDYPWKKGITVLNAISMAGGLTEYGTTKNIDVVPNIGGRSGKAKRVQTDYEVQPGDTIVVKEGWF